MQQKQQFYLDTIIFTILCLIMINGVIPQIQKGPNAIPVSNEYFDVTSLYFNEYYLKNPQKTSFYQASNDYLHQGEVALNFADLYASRFDTATYNHTMSPIYRAVKTGNHLSNMGYNETGYWGEEACKVTKNRKIITNLDYQSHYFSVANNSAEIIYRLIPKHLKHVTNIDEEIELAGFMTKLNYFLGFFLIIGYILFYTAIYKRLGRITALFTGAALLLNPQPFFLTLIPNHSTVFSLYFFAYIIYFYIPISKNFIWKNFGFYALGFIIINVLFTKDNIQFPLIFTWALSIGLMFYIDIVNAVKKSYSLPSFIGILKPSILRLTSLGLLSLFSIIPFYLAEMKQAELWSGITPPSNFKRLFSPSNTAGLEFKTIIIRTIGKIYRLFQFNHLTPWLWIEYYFPHIEIKIKTSQTIKQIIETFFFIPLYQLVLIFLIYWTAIGRKMNFNSEFYHTLRNIIIGVSVYFIWFLGFHLLFPRPALIHYHIHGSTLTFINTLILFISTGYITEKYKTTLL